MSEEYDIELDGQKFRVGIQRLDEGGLLVVSVDGQSYTLKPIENPDGSWTINDTASDHMLRVLNRSGSSVKVELDGREREIQWSRVRRQAAAAAVASAGVSPGPAGKKVEGGVYPPMPGKITEVKVKVGDEVHAGDTVCVLEAMKMFNELKAPCDGVVKEVNIETGSSVTPADLLVLIE